MKKLYIWQWVGPVSANWHNEGGLLIVTAGDPLEAWRSSSDYVKFGDEEADLSKPDWVIEVADETPDKVYVFPDAGCC